MLSRVADSLYWMSRYVERAENVARFIDVNLTLMLDTPDEFGQQWLPLVNTTGDHEDFEKRYRDPTQENVIRFLTFDAENPNSILSCLRAARENARSVREIISSEMWLQLNKFFLTVKSAAERDVLNHGSEFFESIRLSSQLFSGVMNATMTHGEAWHFCRLGRMIERADKTSRILDVKYFILHRKVEDVGTPIDDIQWAAVLRSASAFEMYRKKHGRITPRGVADFLLLDHEFPRAVQYCLIEARGSLHAVSGTPVGSFRYPPEKLLGLLCSELTYSSVEDVIRAGLHEYIDALQDKLNEIGNGIHDTFFALKSPESRRGDPGQRGGFSSAQVQPA